MTMNGALRIHLVAICGVGMAPLAVMLKRAGHVVTGSDRGVFPPMSDVLAAAGIDVAEGFSAERLESMRPDLVIVGNAVTRSNDEAAAVERIGLRRMSFPEALRAFFLEGNRSLVVAGTHGKTTTTGMLATALEAAGERPGYLIGGLIRDLGEFARPGSGGYFVVEGDEYDTAYFDKQPKFLHYAPYGVIVTSIEFDHADIYRDLDHVKSAFSRLGALVPADGPLVAYGDSENVRSVFDGGPRRSFYGIAQGNDWRAESVSKDARGARFVATYRGGHEAHVGLALHGEMNVLNALAAYALCRELGVASAGVLDALASYRGATRRQEILGEVGGVTVVDDFAHHPTAVAATLAAIRDRFPERRLCAVFEPRSNTTRRAVFQDRYAAALAAADVVALSAVYRKENDPLTPEQMLSTERLITDLCARNVAAWSAAGPDDILERLARDVEPGDVVVCMSNGSFGNLPRRLLERLARRSVARAGV